jgi:ATP-grasp domain
MRAFSTESILPGKVRVLSIGNIYEASLEPPVPFATVPAVTVADDRHLSQKAAYWLTEHGFPEVAICTVAPLTPPELVPARHVVCPERRTSSLCLDLLSDFSARSLVLSHLPADEPVFITAYIVTSHLAAVAAWLVAAGRRVVGWPDQMVYLTRRYASKALAQEELYASDERLLDLRPACAVARSLADLRDVVPAVARAGGGEAVVVKSAVSSGGEGVFFVDAGSISGASDVREALLSHRDGVRYVAPPFVVEARVPTVASPTVDILVHADGGLSLWGVSVQRLHDRRYYRGFYRPSRKWLEGVDWYAAVLDATERLGRAVAARGYVGFLNIDFVIDPRGRPYVVEINPRRSALLDGTGFASFWSGDGLDLEVSMAEYAEALVPESPAAARALPHLGAQPPDGIVSIVLDGGFAAYRWLGLVAVAPEGSEHLLRAAIESVGGRDGRAETELIGVVEADG